MSVALIILFSFQYRFKRHVQKTSDFRRALREGSAITYMYVYAKRLRFDGSSGCERSDTVLPGDRMSCCVTL